MPTISTLTVDVTANTSRFRTGIRAVGSGLAVMAGAAAFAFKQFEDAQKVTAQTQAALESTGGAANVTAKQIDRLANSLSRKTGIDDETIQSGENVLLTFTAVRNEVGKGNDVFDRATKLTLDMSVAMGQDLNSSMIMVGKALNDPILGLTSLSRIGVRFTEDTKEQITTLVEQGNTLAAQKIILRELSTEFSGSAEAQKTATGTMVTALGNLAETVGALVAPAITFLIEGILDLVKSIQKDVGPAFEVAVEWLSKVWEAVRPVAEAFGRELVEALSESWQVIKTKLWPALKDLFEALGPVLKVVGQVAGAVVMLALEAIPVLVEEIATWIQFITRVVEAFKDLIHWVSENLVGPIVGAIQRIIEWLQRAAAWVSEKFGAAWQAIKGPVLAVIGAIIAAIQTLVGWVVTAVEKLASLFALEASAPFPTKGGTFGAPPIPEAQTGGFVSRSGLAVIHAGEHVIPPGDGFGGVNITVNGWVGDEAALVKKLVEALNRNGRRNGGGTLAGAT